MPWDLGVAPGALTRWLAQANRPGRVLIPGCGRGHEVRAFHDAGWDVLAIDYTPGAVAGAKENLALLADKVMLADFFTHDFGGKRFDVVYERTFLCAMPPARWGDYARRMNELIEENGELVGLFLFGVEDDPPPYPLRSPAEQMTLLGQFFELTADGAVPDSPAFFAGRERWQVWRRLAYHPGE
jgi:SAM-dependent methyltransferase